MTLSNILFICSVAVALLFTFVNIEKMVYKQTISAANNVLMAVSWTMIICKFGGIW